MRLQSDGAIGVPEMKPSHVQLNLQYVAVYRQAEINDKLEHQPKYGSSIPWQDVLWTYTSRA